MIPLLAADEADNVLDWFRAGDHRAVSDPIPDQLLVTLQHSFFALVIAAAIALPLALVLAHHRKAEVAAAAVINVGRAIPTVAILGILVLVFLAAGQGFSQGPIVLALVLLALPPLFTNAYAAVRGVDPGAVSAARAMGFTERDLMLKVELPLALPIIVTGLRIATVQVIATEPLGAFFAGDGLGVYLRNGLANQDFSQVQAGALLVTATAIGADLLLYLASRAVLPRGVRRTARARPSRLAKTRPAPST